MTRPVSAAAAAALLAAAVVLALLGADVLRWQSRGDAVPYAALPESADAWRADGILPRALAEGLLAVRDDLRFRQAVQEYRFHRGRPGFELLTAGRRIRRGLIEADLATIAESDADAGRRSQARTFHGAFLLEELRSQEVPVEIFVRRAIADLREAIRLDASNEAAKYDLELALRVVQRIGRFREDLGGRPGGGRRGAPGGAGAGSYGAGF